MDVKAFYAELAEWVLSINVKAQELNQEGYWNYVLVTAGMLSNKYNDTPLVKHIINSHIDFLESSLKQHVSN